MNSRRISPNIPIVFLFSLGCPRRLTPEACGLVASSAHGLPGAPWSRRSHLVCSSERLTGRPLRLAEGFFRTDEVPTTYTGPPAARLPSSPQRRRVPTFSEGRMRSALQVSSTATWVTGSQPVPVRASHTACRLRSEEDVEATLGYETQRTPSSPAAAIAWPMPARSSLWLRAKSWTTSKGPSPEADTLAPAGRGESRSRYPSGALMTSALAPERSCSFRDRSAVIVSPPAAEAR